MAVRSKNPNMYNFLVSEFQNDKTSDDQLHDDQYRFVKSSDTYRVKALTRPKPISTLQTRMISDSSIPTMTSGKNIDGRKMYSMMVEKVNVKDVDYDSNYEDEIKQLEILAQQSKVNIPARTRMASSSNTPIMTYMANSKNITKYG